MAKFIIEGGKRLKGEIHVSGSKNSALALIAASTLLPETRLTNIPRIRDVERMLEIIVHLGGTYAWHKNKELVIETQNLSSRPLPEAARKLRASILFAGPLLARFGKAELPYPGGDIIGARSLDSHLNAFRALGVLVEEGEHLNFSVGNICGGKVVLEETSVTATENVLMLAATCDNLTEIRLAATEPHVQDLCQFLSRAGASIEGIGSPILKIQGGKLAGVTYEVIPDELEISAFASLAAATHSEVIITPIREEYLDAVFFQLEKMHVNFEHDSGSLRILPPTGSYLAARLQAGLYPKLVTDHLPPFVVLATQAEGTTLVHDWLFEARQNYIRELAKMGASTMIMDPHRALIIGPTPLFGKEVTSYDIRSGMAMLIAALVAKGKTTLLDIEHLDRGYERLEERLKALGAHMERAE